MGLKLSPFLEFLQFFKISNDERLIRGFAIEKEVSKMKEKIQIETLWMKDEEKIEFGAGKIKWIERTLETLAYSKSYEKNLLINLKAYINIICGNSSAIPNFSENSKIFKSAESEHMFIAGLKEMNVINENLSPKRGFQTVANALFQSSFKDQMFVNNLRVTEFILYLNDKFSASIAAKDRLPDPDNYEQRIESFIRSYNS